MIKRPHPPAQRVAEFIAGEVGRFLPGVAQRPAAGKQIVRGSSINRNVRAFSAPLVDRLSGLGQDRKLAT